MSPTALANYFLGEDAEGFVESAVYERPEDRRYIRRTIVLARKPRFSGFAAICEAPTVTVSYSVEAPVPENQPMTQSPAAEPKKREDGFRFRIIGAAPGGQLHDGEAEGAEQACAAAGPVLDREDERGGRFFQVWDGTPTDLDFAVRALREAQAEAKASAHVPECERDVFLDTDSMCRDPVGALTRLDWQRLEGVAIPPDKQSSLIQNFTFFFRRDPRETPGADHVHVEMSAVKEDQGPPRIESIGLTGVHYVD